NAWPFNPDQKRVVIFVGGGTDISSQGAAAAAGKMAWIDGRGVALSATLCRLDRKREIAPRIPDKSTDYPRDAQIFRRTRLYRSGNADDASGAGGCGRAAICYAPQYLGPRFVFAHCAGALFKTSGRRRIRPRV